MAMTTYDGMDFDKKLKFLMRKHRYSQTDVAESVGVSQSLVSLWVNGKSVPAMYEAAKLAKLLGVDVEFLADDAQDEPAASEFTEAERNVVDLMRAMRLERQEALRRLATPSNPSQAAPVLLSGQAALDAIAASTPILDPPQVIEPPKRSAAGRSRRKA